MTSIIIQLTISYIFCKLAILFWY